MSEDEAIDPDQFNSDAASKIWIYAFLFPIFLFLIGSLWNQPSSYSNTQFFLRTLILAESSVIAIIFSVLFLGIQIISSRYSTRLGRLFFKDELFQATTVLLVLAISFDLGLIYFLPRNQGSIYLGLVFASVGISAVAFYSLILTVGRMVTRSTPEGVIFTASSLVSFDDFHNYALSDSDQSPPTQDLYAFTTASLAEKEPVSAQTAFREYIRLIQRILVQQARSDDFIEYSPAEKRQFFEPIIGTQLPNIYLSAVREEHHWIQKESLACIRQIAEIFAEIEDSVVLVCTDGFFQIWDQLSEYGEEEHTNEVVRQLLAFSLFAAETNRINGVNSIISGFLDHFESLDEWNNVDVGNSNQLLQYIGGIHRNILLHMDEVEVVGARLDTPVQLESRVQHTEVLNRTHDLIEICVSYGLKHGGAIDHVQTCLGDMFQSCYRLNHHDYAEYIVQMTVELVLLDLSENGKERLEDWSMLLAEMRYEGDSNIVDEAISEVDEQIKAERFQGAYRSVADLQVDLEIINQSPSAPYQDLVQYINIIRETVDTEHEQLLWQEVSVSELREIVADNPEIIETGLQVQGHHRTPPRHLPHSFTASLIGQDSLISVDSDGIFTFIKLVQSLNPEDADDLVEIRNQIYEQIIHQRRTLILPARPVHGPFEFRFIIATPKVDPTSRTKLEDSNIEVFTVNSRQFRRRGLERQLTIADFFVNTPDTYSSDLIQ